MKYLIYLFLLLPIAGLAETSVIPNWTGRYSPCNNHSELLSREHVDLGVRIATANPELAVAFAKALDFWAGVLDIDWHETGSDDCALQVVDGTPSLFNFCRCMSARAQLPDQPAFQGWIAFNPRLKLTKHEMFLDSVHEIGHVLGLSHNPSDSSVMFYLGLGKIVSLNARDLDTLAARHQLRPEVSMERVPVVAPRMDRRVHSPSGQ